MVISKKEPKPEYNDYFKKVIDAFLDADENKQKEIREILDLKTTQQLLDLLKDKPLYISVIIQHLNKKPEESSTETEIIPEKKKSNDLRLPESHTQKKTTSQKEQEDDASTKKRHEQQETKEQRYKRLQTEAIEKYIETRLQGQDVFSTRRGLSNEKKLNTLYQKYDDFDDFIKTHYSELADNIKQSVLRENEQNRQRIITLAKNKHIRFPNNVKSDIEKIIYLKKKEKERFQSFLNMTNTTYAQLVKENFKTDRQKQQQRENTTTRSQPKQQKKAPPPPKEQKTRQVFRKKQQVLVIRIHVCIIILHVD